MTVSGESSVTAVEVRGTPALRLETPGGSTAVVALHGAHLLSWCPAGGRERLFLSERAEYAPGKAIRGGVPICFPQFAALGPLPKHGLVRTRPWQVVARRADAGEAAVTLAFEPDAEARGLWPHPCRVEVEVRLGDGGIALGLSVENRGAGPLPFTAALHGYFDVGDVERVAVEGLAGLEYRDAADRDALRTERSDAVAIRGEVDRVYHSVPGEVILREPGRALALRAEGFPDVVIWNPGAAKCAALSDMAPDGWRRMLCVEAGAIRTPVAVAPGAIWRGRQLLTPILGA
jgi:glucose-6-phosphate 1-epimerase